MGKKKSAEKIILTFAALFLLCPTTCHAATPIDLYEMYQMTPPKVVSSDVTEIISSYQKAKREAAMYGGISRLDISNGYGGLRKQLSEYKSKQKKLLKSLDNGFKLSLTEIHSIEEECLMLDDKIAELEEKLSHELQMPEITDVSSAPTKEQYVKAVTQRDTMLKQSDIGVIHNIDLGASVLSSVEGKTVLETPPDTVIKALFNGVCVDSTESTVTLDCGYGILYSYTGLSDTYISKGDSVSQYDYIGKSRVKNISLALQLQGNPVDASLLLEE